MSELTFTSRQQDGMNIHTLSTEKFKTNTVTIHIALPLAEETVTKGALLPNVLQRGCAKYPTQGEMQRHLDDLYGAIFSAEVMKKGERQVIQLYLEIANEKFLSDSRPLLKEGMAFLGEVLHRPLVEEDGFTERYVALEKESLVKRIEGLIDDKMRYANHRVTEEMCKDEPYRLLAYGIKEKVPEISPQDLYAFYQDLLKTAPVDVYVVGDVKEEDVLSLIKQHLVWGRTDTDVRPLPANQYRKSVVKENVVVDQMNVAQGKLNIGMRTQIGYADDAYVHLMMYNGVLGGFPHSKLFTNVREKASLAYYAVSQLESHKGLCMIMSGIETANYDKAVAIIKEQLEMMKKGEITDTELTQTKATLSNQLRETQDSAGAIIAMDYNGRLNGSVRRLEDTLNQIGKTTKEDIANVASQVEIDTIYFLRGKEDGK
ncbi:EF-P 5-aminopentanol modification-associated protein YfmF [Aneurinibacillus terranovensis]|uniref:EF-P 5-aminopentanol modification-associated protein YfmF n=1 Tax=Aneurinibacillus terranovensis TaxID=278991 RepID=UPI0003FAA504|nr:pitrilysin family protein [Aneurinibacillus terranovensis]